MADTAPHTFEDLWATERRFLLSFMQRAVAPAAQAPLLAPPAVPDGVKAGFLQGADSMETLARLSPEELEEELPSKVKQFYSASGQDGRQTLLLAYRRLCKILADKEEGLPYEYLAEVSSERLIRDVAFLARLESDCLSESLIKEIRSLSPRRDERTWIDAAVNYMERHGQVQPFDVGWMAGYANIFYNLLDEAIASDNLIAGTRLLTSASIGLTTNRLLPSEERAQLEDWASAGETMSAYQRLMIAYIGGLRLKYTQPDFSQEVFFGFLARKLAVSAESARHSAGVYFPCVREVSGKKESSPRRAYAPSQSERLPDRAEETPAEEEERMETAKDFFSA